MPLGKESAANLSTCEPVLQDIIREAVAGVDEGDLAWAGIRDLSVTCGWRGQADQEKAFSEGNSKVHWPNSAHNKLDPKTGKPRARAADVVPYPEMWSDVRKMEILHAYINGIAQAHGVDLKDIDWDRPHVELA